MVQWVTNRITVSMVLDRTGNQKQDEIGVPGTGIPGTDASYSTERERYSAPGPSVVERLPGIAPQPQYESAIDRIDREMIQLFALVGEGVAGATDSLLSGDRETARVLADSDEVIDMLYREIETLTQRELVDGTSDSGELHYLVAVLRMLPELERSGDLAQHVASRAVRGLGTEMSHRARGLVERMGELCSEMWRLTADAYADRSAEHANEVEELDDDLDHLHVILTAEIASGSMSLPVTIESALVARFYERFGDHAVNLTRRIVTLVNTPHGGH